MRANPNEDQRQEHLDEALHQSYIYVRLMAWRRHPVLACSRSLGKELVVLQLLLREKRLFGLQLVAASKGRLKRGTVYVTLGRMEEKGYITSTLEDPPPGAGGLPRRLYEPTALGRRMVRTWTSGATRVIPEFAQ